MSKKIKPLFLLYGITTILYLGGSALFQGNVTGNEMGFSVLNYWILMPLTALIITLIQGLKNLKLKWLYPVFCGLLGYIAPQIMFGSWDYVMLWLTCVPAILGIIIGIVIRLIAKKVHHT